MTRLTDDHERYLMALYYAYGRLDGSHFDGSAYALPDPPAFADYYVRLWREHTTFMPAVQNAWADYRRAERIRLAAITTNP